MIERADKVIDKLDHLRKLSQQHNNVGVIVGYTASYALHVHEMVGESGRPKRGKGIKRRKPHKGMYWDPQGRGQSKFLEQPFREHQKELLEIITTVIKAQGNFAKGAGLDKGLMVVGLYLQRLSQELVPVDTGNLKGSAFTRLIEDNRGKG